MFKLYLRFSLLLTALILISLLIDLAQRAMNNPIYWILFTLGLFLFPFYLFLGWKGVEVIINGTKRRDSQK